MSEELPRTITPLNTVSVPIGEVVDEEPSGTVRTGREIHPEPSVFTSMTGASEATLSGDLCPSVLTQEQIEERKAYEWSMWNFPYKSLWAATRQALPVTLKSIACGNAHTLMVSTTGEVWVFGNNDYGQLGIGNNVSQATAQLVRFLHGHTVVQVAAGGWHSMFVTNNGRVYSCGDNRYGQLGQGHTANTHLPRLCVSPASDAMTEVACGTFHSLLLSNTGVVWTCGWNHFGQLGLPFLDSDHEAVPRPLMSYKSVKPCRVRAGTFHSMFITEGGDLWTWGRGDNGQLGHGRTAHEPVPRIVDFFVSAHWIRDVAGGDTHTIAITDASEAFSFGSGPHGQLGLGKDTLQALTPQPITTLDELDGDIAAQVGAGYEHSFVVMESGDLLTFGYGAAGRLGHNTQKRTFVPLSVRRLKHVGSQREQEFFPIKYAQPVKRPDVSDAEAREVSKIGKALAELPNEIRSQYTDAELIELKRCFDQIDLDGGGSLDEEELLAAFESMGESLSIDEVRGCIKEVDDNGNGVIEFDEFVTMVSNMRSGKSSFKLSLLLNLLPDGNEVSENAMNRIKAYGTALRTANARLEARRVFGEMDVDHNGMLDFKEIKTGLRRLGMPLITDSDVQKIMDEFDENGDGGIDEGEFLEHYGRVFEQRDSSLIGQLLHAIMFFPRKRVSKTRSARFASRFKQECEKRHAALSEALAARIDNIAAQVTTHGEKIAKGKLDLYNCEMRDTHMAALAETLIAYPIAHSLRLSRNHITDAGVSTLIDLLKEHMARAETPEGAGGLRKVKMSKKVKGFGALMTEAAAKRANESTVSGLKGKQSMSKSMSRVGEGKEDDGDDAATVGATTTTESSVLLPRTSFLKGVLKQKEIDALESSHRHRSLGSPTVTFPPLVSESSQRLFLRGGNGGGSAEFSDGSDGEGMPAMDSLFASVPPNSVAMHTSFKGSEDDDAGGAVLDSALIEARHPYNWNIQQRVHRRRAPPPSQMGVPSRFDESKKIGIIKCRECGTEDVRYTFAFVGLKAFFSRFLDFTSCRVCGYEWCDPVHFVLDVKISDYMKPERLLTLAKYRFQTEARTLMYALVQSRPHSLLSVQRHHVELVKSHVKEFDASAKSAGALGARRSRLSAELLRYGMDAFRFVENDYYSWTKAMVRQTLVDVANSLITRCRAYYKVAILPRERDKFLTRMMEACGSARTAILDSMPGWTLKKRDISAAFASLDVVYARLREFYMHQLENISVAVAGGGSNFSVVLTRGGSAWAFGSGEDGRTCQMHDAPCLEPAIVLVARPMYEAMVSNTYRLHMYDASSWTKCDIGYILANVEKGARVIFSDQIIPPDFIGVRFRLRIWGQGGAIVVRANAEDGPVLTAAFVKNTSRNADGDPEWEIVESPAEKHLSLKPHDIVVMFEDHDCCEIEWFEFFVAK